MKIKTLLAQTYYSKNSMEFSKKIEQELKTITLSSNDYLELVEKLRELGLSELRDKVLQKGAFTYR